MTIYIFGNPDLHFDSLPIRILPHLKKNFPEIKFQIKDPNENWEIPEELVIIDTIVGIQQIKVFNNIQDFVNPRRISIHDFDLLTELKYLSKLGRIKKIKIIGIPPTLKEKEALVSLQAIINSLNLKR